MSNQAITELRNETGTIYGGLSHLESLLYAIKMLARHASQRTDSTVTLGHIETLSDMGLEHAERHAEIASSLESLVDDLDKPIIKPGHQAAADWYADLTRRLAKANRYQVPSNLAATVAALPADDASDFLDAWGAMTVSALCFGPIVPGFVWDSELIRVQSLAPADQDAHYDAMEANDD